MSRVYLGLGSNVQPEIHLRKGIAALKAEFGELILSPVYESAASGFKGNNFLNLAARMDTRLSVAELSDWLRKLEFAFGRAADACKYSDRKLDIDILLFDKLIIDGDGLKLPRADILGCAYVLKPLADIAPDVVHPECDCSILELWQTFSDSGKSDCGLTLREIRLQP